MQISNGGYFIQTIIGATKCPLITIVYNRKVGWRTSEPMGITTGPICITLAQKSWRRGVSTKSRKTSGKQRQCFIKENYANC